MYLTTKLPNPSYTPEVMKVLFLKFTSKMKSKNKRFFNSCVLMKYLVNATLFRVKILVDVKCAGNTFYINKTLFRFDFICDVSFGQLIY